MKQFMDENFLLETETAQRLYHDHAAKMPIIDYHCHINPAEIAEDKRYDNITQVWLGGDHYKWRAMRCNGVPECDITGCKDSDPYRTFERWAETLPRAIGNPLYPWTYLELKRYFGITEALNPKSAERIYSQCNARLQEADMSVRGIIEQSNVKLICTTDDPVDNLEWHKKIKEDATCNVKVLPAFRPDKAMNIQKPEFAAYIATLAEVSGMAIATFADLEAALASRITFFNDMGCRASDHALDYPIFVPATQMQLNAILAKGMESQSITLEEQNQYKTAILLSISKKYKEYDWVMQIHFGCIRDNNTPWYNKLGPDTGFDAVSNTHGVDDLGQLMNAMSGQGTLPKMVLYSLNQYDNEAIMTLAGCFQVDGACASQIQMGAAWWFNDTKTGMEKQLTDFANLGTLGNFIGMLTDSRSFLSYTRHEYFRRILCNWIGNLVENGEYHADMETLGQLVEDISYNNTVKFFGFEV